MKKLVIYYSFEGNTKFMAEIIARTLKADLLQLKPKNEIKTHGFFKFPIGGAQVVFRIKPKLQKFDLDLQKYDILIIGTPAWALSYSPAIHTFIKKTEIKNKKIALFCSRMGNKGWTFKKLKKRLPNNEFIGELDLSEPLLKEKNENKKRIKKWAEEIQNNLK